MDSARQGAYLHHTVVFHQVHILYATREPNPQFDADYVSRLEDQPLAHTLFHPFDPKKRSFVDASAHLV